MTVKRALNELQIANGLVHVVNGEDALEYLRGEANEKPCVIFLDLNMPKMNGIEFLKVRKEDDELKQIPVVVFTTSEDDEGRIDNLQLDVAGYIIKTLDYKKFVDAIRATGLFWALSESPPDSK
jgi:DNA-binding NarL/FixJ family response regulator